MAERGGWQGTAGVTNLPFTLTGQGLGHNRAGAAVNRLYCGDNLDVLRKHIADDSVEAAFGEVIRLAPLDCQRHYVRLRMI